MIRAGADPDFDDAAWETVDLTPPAGAHDADVGLTGYVPGWTARGHLRYSGYAWYRLRVTVAARPAGPLALDGPRAVDSAYQVFVNGRLLGSAGDFSGPVPVAYSIQPRLFPLPMSLGNGVPAVVAFRVWMSAGLAGVPGTGGIHIAPALGETGAVGARYQVEWLETVRGYIVEVAEAGAFVLLAAMSCTFLAFDRANRAYLWLSGGLLLTALQRANQAFFFWTQCESVRVFDGLISVLVLPLALGVWTMAWWVWFGLRRPAWVPGAVGVLTLLYMASQWLGRSWFPVVFFHRFGPGFHAASADLRLAFLLGMAFIACQGACTQGRAGWPALLVIALIATGLFVPELSALHPHGLWRDIWFPWGTGVSRTQFAYAGFDVALFALLWHRLLLFARRGQSASSAPLPPLA